MYKDISHTLRRLAFGRYAHCRRALYPLVSGVLEERLQSGTPSIVAALGSSAADAVSDRVYSGPIRGIGGFPSRGPGPVERLADEPAEHAAGGDETVARQG